MSIRFRRCLATAAIAAAAVALGPHAAMAQSPSDAPISKIYYDSGTIATGGTAQNISWTLSQRRLECVQNPQSASEDLWVALGTAAVVNQSQDLPPGKGVCWAWAGATWSVLAATTGHAFIAFEAY